MPQSPNPQDVTALDSITHLTEAHRGLVVAAASHGAVYAAYLAAKGGVRAVILNDAGIGKDQAGISRLPVLDEQGIAAATVTAASARIGDGCSTYESGVLSRVNATAAGLGIAPGMTAREAVEWVVPAAI